MAYNTLNETIAFIAGKLPPVIAQPPAYPFIGEKKVREALREDYDLQEAVLCLMFHLQTDSEQEKRDTEVKNRCGFMSSDAFTGTKLAMKLILDDVLEHEEIDRVTKIASKYAKQTTVQLRRFAMMEDPKLAAYAAIFSVK